MLNIAVENANIYHGLSWTLHIH